MTSRYNVIALELHSGSFTRARAIPKRGRWDFVFFSLHAGDV